MHVVGFFRGRIVRHAFLVAAVLSVSTSLVLGRAGYYRPPAGNAGSGMRIRRGEPNHYLGAVRLPGGPVISHSSRGHSFQGEAGGRMGANSGMEGQIESAFSSTWHATQSAPYESDARYQPQYYENYNSYWLHGYWGGGLWGWGRWCGDLGVWSLPRWSMGPIFYPSGYGVYRNPFLEGLQATALAATDQVYAFPIPIKADDAGSSNIRDSHEPTRVRSEEILRDARKELTRSPREAAAMKKFDQSRDAFRNGNYGEALEGVEAAMAILPEDVAFHQYRALILFARADYRRAAIALYAVISSSPGFDWTTLSGFYVNQATYTDELRKLEARFRANPDSADAAFLLSCHYLTCRHFDAALRKMTTAAQLLPNDPLVRELTVFLKGAAEFESRPLGEAEVQDEPPSDNRPATHDGPPASDGVQLAGRWRAARGEEIQIDFELTAEGLFRWITREGKTQHEFSGKYVSEGDRLILIGQRGMVLAQWTQSSPTRFNFKLLENDPADAGLMFVKEK